MSTLYIVATPIGNLLDISPRAVETLRGADLILCEDTRQTKKLLQHFDIKTKTLSYHQHSMMAKTDYLLELLAQGKNLALVSDAGTPGISDPGNKLVELAIEKLQGGVVIVPIPGPSALISAASISGFPMDRFLFLGFAPHKNKRKKFFEEIKNTEHPVIFYESCHRIIKTIKELDPEIELAACRELTKKFETIYRGKPKDVLEALKPEEIRGEFTLVIKGKKR